MRIQYENAVYHVMNRGKGRSVIFPSEAFSMAFLKCLEETHAQFGLEVLAYCLMKNHYHLLVRTPRANLDRCMRHINGVYTQRHNKLLQTDGSLFRGRYKAILVDVDNYLLQVSRYIHRNPLELKKPIISSLVDYPYSSYPAYINQEQPPDWLNCDLVLSSQNASKKYSAYRNYVENFEDGNFNEFYNQKKLPPILGQEDFIKTAQKYKLNKNSEISNANLFNLISKEIVTEKVSNYFNVPLKNILTAHRGTGNKNIPRRVAMYLCKRYTGLKLIEIAQYFNVNHYSTVSQSISRLLKEKEIRIEIQKAINVLSQDLTP